MKNRKSRPLVFCKKGVLKNFLKFTRKNLYQSLFFNKVAGLRPANLLKKRLWNRVFPVNFGKFPRTPFFTEHLWWLLLEKNCSSRERDSWTLKTNIAWHMPLICQSKGVDKLPNLVNVKSSDIKPNFYNLIHTKVWKKFIHSINFKWNAELILTYKILDDSLF